MHRLHCAHLCHMQFVPGREFHVGEIILGRMHSPQVLCITWSNSWFICHSISLHGYRSFLGPAVCTCQTLASRSSDSFVRLVATRAVEYSECLVASSGRGRFEILQCVDCRCGSCLFGGQWFTSVYLCPDLSASYRDHVSAVRSAADVLNWKVFLSFIVINTTAIFYRATMTATWWQGGFKTERVPTQT